VSQKSKPCFIQCEESWLDIKGYEDFYSVSSEGKVWSKRSEIFMKGKALAGIGYPCVNLSVGNVQKLFNIHRLVAEAFIPNPSNYRCINHIDRVKANNNRDNLEWCTHKQNSRHFRKLDGFTYEEELFQNEAGVK